MTREEIEKMSAGREMDALVMEWVTKFTVDDNFHIPSYSTDIAAAWAAVEKLQEIYPDYDFYLEKSGRHVEFWFRINDTSQGGWNSSGAWDKRISDAEADTAPLAICRAALLAVMELK